MEKNQVSVSELGQRLERIETLLRGQKETLTFDEAAAYIRINKSYFYKLTAGCKISHYKVDGKTLTEPTVP
jgi:excisionase family DNA binding protein